MVLQTVLQKVLGKRMHKDSLIVACSKENFNKIYLNEMAWYPIPIAKDKITQIKYVFAYQKSPIAAITHVATVKDISIFEGTKKYIVRFKKAPEEIKHIEMGQDQRNVPQNPRYSTYDIIIKSDNMDSIYGEIV